MTGGDAAAAVPPVAVIVQARMSSRRLPGKMLREVGGRSLLGWVIERLRPCRHAGPVIVATSSDRDDDALAAACAELGVAVFRGPLDDVAGRYLGAAERFGLDAFVRVTGDSPLIDPALVDAVVALYREGEADLATNVFPRRFPKGQSLEALNAAAFAALQPDLTDPLDREHITRFYYAHPGRFRIRALVGAVDCSDEQLSVDTPEDLARFAAIVAAMTRPHGEYGWAELRALARDVTS